MNDLTTNIDVPEFMKAKPYRKAIKVEVNGEEIFYCLDAFLEKHYSKIMIAALIYVTSHVMATFIK